MWGVKMPQAPDTADDPWYPFNAKYLAGVDAAFRKAAASGQRKISFALPPPNENYEVRGRAWDVASCREIRLTGHFSKHGISG